MDSHADPNPESASCPDTSENDMHPQTWSLDPTRILTRRAAAAGRFFYLLVEGRINDLGASAIEILRGLPGVVNVAVAVEAVPPAD